MNINIIDQLKEDGLPMSMFNAVEPSSIMAFALYYDNLFSLTLKNEKDNM